MVLHYSRCDTSHLQDKVKSPVLPHGAFAREDGKVISFRDGESPLLEVYILTCRLCITLLLVLQTVFEVEGRARKTTERIG